MRSTERFFQTAPLWTGHCELALKTLYYPPFAWPQTVSAMTSSAEDGEILTLREVADFLKVTERTIYRLAAARKIPAFKVGGVWRFSRAEIDGWIQRESKGAKGRKV